jgi:nucleoside phosphorylase
MIYIICAFEAEARALIDHYRLQKDSTQPYPLFYDEQKLILISGMGQQKAKEAVEYLLSQHMPSPNDVLVNLGICAAQERFPIGTLLHVHNLRSESESFELTDTASVLAQASCYSTDKALAQTVETDIAEMEAISIYKAASKFFAPSKISILKVVSDHFKPFKIKKQFIIDLIKPHIKEIDAHLKRTQGDTDVR